MLFHIDLPILRIDLPIPFQNPKFRERILRHLKRLSPEDRYMRFFTPATDDFIESYVDRLLDKESFGLNALFVRYDDFGREIIGLVDACAVKSKTDEQPTEFELGISVDVEHRKHGLGYMLYEEAFSWLSALGAKRVFMSCLTTNVPMQRIVKKFNMASMSEDGERTAELELPGTKDVVGLLVGNSRNLCGFYDLMYRRQLSDIWSMTAGWPFEDKHG